MRTINNLCAIIARRPDAVAFVNGSEKYKEIRGQVSFYELNDSVIVRAEVSGLPKGNGNCDNPILKDHSAVALPKTYLRMQECITIRITVNILIMQEICRRFLAWMVLLYYYFLPIVSA